jgi:hypothetical protein
MRSEEFINCHRNPRTLTWVWPYGQEFFRSPLRGTLAVDSAKNGSQLKGLWIKTDVINSYARPAGAEASPKTNRWLEWIGRYTIFAEAPADICAN